MSQFLNKFKTGARVAVLALALGGGVVAAMPAQAAGIQIGSGFNGGSFSLYFGNGPRTHACMTDRQLRRALDDEGFYNIQIGEDLGRNRVSVVAAYDGRWYKMRVNRCSGDIDHIQRLKVRHNSMHDFNDSNGNSFGLSLNFGN